MTINNPVLEKYKTYFTERVKGKDGITRPVTKVKYLKDCVQCGGKMDLEKYTKATYSKPAIIKWKCPDKKCKHSEQERNQREMIADEIYKDLKYGECIHGENLAGCDICNERR